MEPAQTPRPYLTGNSPFPQEYLDKLYPKQRWQHLKDLSLHFLLAFGTPDAATIGVYLQNNPNAVWVCDPQNGNLTPLHLAAMKANRAAAERILQENKLCLFAQTTSGFSPLHIAALTSDELYDLFIRNGADQEQKTSTGMSCKDLRLLSGRVVDVRSAASLYYQESPDQVPMLLASDGSLKAKVFGEDFFHTDIPLFDPQFFPKLGKQKTASHPYFVEAYHNYVQNRPKLIIGPSEQLKQMELRTKERIEAGCVVTEYTGMKCKVPFYQRFADNFTLQSIQEIEYRGFNKIDAKRAGNESRFINCGFPNSSVVIVEVDGVERALVVALEDIAPGMPILLDYGMDMFYLVYGTQKLLGKDRMISFYKKHGSHLLDVLEQGQKKYDIRALEKTTTWKDVNELSALQEWFAFPFQNPTALLYLHFRKSVDYIKLCKTMETSRLTCVNDLVSRLSYQHILNIVRILTKIKSKYKKGEWDKIAAWVSARLEKIPLTHIIKGLDLFARGKKANEVNQILEKYNWLEDEDHPLSYRRRVDNLVEIYKKMPKDEIIPQLKATLKDEDKKFESYHITLELIKRLHMGK